VDKTEFRHATLVRLDSSSWSASQFTLRQAQRSRQAQGSTPSSTQNLSTQLAEFLKPPSPQNQEMPCHHEHCEHAGEQANGSAESLFCRIDTNNVSAMNEATKDSIKGVFKPWDKRWDSEPLCFSDSDDQLIVRVPFTGLLKVKSVTILGPGGELDPKAFKLFVNKDVDFDSVDDIAADQEFECVQQARNTQGGPLGNVDVPEYAVKASKFSNVRFLSILVAQSWGGEHVCITYIGFKGEFMQPFKDPVTNIVYELNANPADHKIPGAKGGIHEGFGF